MDPGSVMNVLGALPVIIFLLFLIAAIYFGVQFFAE